MCDVYWGNVVSLFTMKSCIIATFYENDVGLKQCNVMIIILMILHKMMRWWFEIEEAYVLSADVGFAC